MKTLEFLEKRILETIEICSVFQIHEIEPVYQKCLSFDTTIKIVNYAMQKAISIEKAMEDLQ